MNVRDGLIVFQADLINTLRDRRTWLTMVVIPLLLVPVLLIAAPMALENQMKKIEATAPEVAVLGEEHGAELAAWIRQSEQVSVVAVDDPEDALDRGDIRAIVRLPQGFADDIAAGRVPEVVIEFDASNQVSEAAHARLQGIVATYAQNLVAARLSELDIDPGILTPLRTVGRNVAPAERVGGLFLSMVMPMMLAVWAALGGMYAAIDSVAGEKERGTLEPLLATPPARGSFVAGKYLAVWLTSVVAGGIALFGMYIAFLIKPDAVMGPETDLSFAISFVSGAVIIGVTALLAAFFSAIELALSAFARTFREAQGYLSPLSIIVVFPGVMTQFADPAEVSVGVFLVPVLNAIFLFKEALMNTIDWGHVGLTALSSIVFVALALKFAAGLFRKESVLFRM